MIVGWLASAFDRGRLYRGEPISDWVDRAVRCGDVPEFYYWGQKEPKSGSAYQQLQRIGAAAMPCLMTRIGAPDRVAHRTWVAVYENLPPLLQLYLPSPPDKRSERAEALRILPLLGSNAAPTTPLLIRLLQQTNDFGSAWLAANSLAAIGPAARDAVPFLTASWRANANIRVPIAMALWSIDRQTNLALRTLVGAARQTNGSGYLAPQMLASMGKAAEPAIPTLIEIVRDGRRDWSDRSQAVFALGKLKVKTADVFAALREASQDTNVCLRVSACRSLWQLDAANAPLVVSAAVEGLRNAIPSHYFCAEVLGELGADARSAIPVLKAACATGPSELRSRAAAALTKIERVDRSESLRK